MHTFDAGVGAVRRGGEREQDESRDGQHVRVGSVEAVECRCSRRRRVA